MINWVAVLRRMLQLYNVKSQQELGMALGIPLNFAIDGTGPESAVPWPILELVVSEKRVSWDWLLEGRGERDICRRDTAAVAETRKAAESPAGGKVVIPPRIETRELARVLLNPGEPQSTYAPPPNSPEEAPASDAPSEPSPEPSSGSSRPGKDSVVRNLESIKTRMQKEIDRVEKLLEDRGQP